MRKTVASARSVYRKMKTLSVPALLFIALLPVLKAQTGSIFGEWEDPTGSTLRIGRCGHEVCIWIAAVSRNAPAFTDIHNPNPGLRQRPLCGLKIGSGFKAEHEDRASGGTLYDPKSGKTYHGEMRVEGQQLRLRGYVGFTLFGKTEIWKRAERPAGACEASLAPSNPGMPREFQPLPPFRETGDLLVPGGGVEPPWPRGPADFESAASASSAIPAGVGIRFQSIA